MDSDEVDSDSRDPGDLDSDRDNSSGHVVVGDLYRGGRSPGDSDGNNDGDKSYGDVDDLHGGGNGGSSDSENTW